jgi:hypothetical protein
MKQRKFNDPYWDFFLQKLIAGERIPADQKEEFLTLLSWDGRFREEFCEWLKSFRDPASAWDHNFNPERKSS